MKKWINITLPVLQQIGNNLPHTMGMIRRWKDDLVKQQLKPISQKIELYSASKNLQHDFKKTAGQNKQSTQVTTNSRKSNLSHIQQKITQQEKAIPSAKLEFSKAKSSNRLTNKTSQTKIQQQSTQKNQNGTSAKQEFAKAKVSGQTKYDFKLMTKRQNNQNLSR